MRSGEHIPQLSDLRESGAIEQDADVVLFVYRPAVYKRRAKETLTPEEEKEAHLVVAKQRNGPTGIVQAVFIDRYARFENYSARYAESSEEGAPF